MTNSLRYLYDYLNASKMSALSRRRCIIARQQDLTMFGEVANEIWLPTSRGRVPANSRKLATVIWQNKLLLNYLCS